jgi:uncharacterized oligopeptide transporter (OPT) family protein
MATFVLTLYSGISAGFSALAVLAIHLVGVDLSQAGIWGVAISYSVALPVTAIIAKLVRENSPHIDRKLFG